MTQEDKQLLLKDLCTRLPYNVVIRCTDNDTDYRCFLTTNILNELLYNIEYYDYKPYLRPMSSMIEDERKEIESISRCHVETIVLKRGGKYHDKIIKSKVFLDNETTEFDLLGDSDGEYNHIDSFIMSDTIDWLLSHHFDFRGLIEKGLALEAPEGVYYG